MVMKWDEKWYRINDENIALFKADDTLFMSFNAARKSGWKYKRDHDIRSDPFFKWWLANA